MFASAFFKRDADITSALRNPSAWFLEVMRGAESSSGEHVSEDTSLCLVPVYAALYVISKTIAQVPLRLYKKTEENGSEVQENNPLHRIVTQAPNDMMSAYVWKERMVYHLASWGNAYNYKLKNRRGEVVELLPLLPDRTSLERTGEGMNVRRYFISNIEGKSVKLPVEDVLFIPGFGFDGYAGYSPIRVHRESLGWQIATQKYSARFFRNGANLRGVIEAPGTVMDIDRLASQFSDAYGGVDNAFKTAILEQGMKYNRIGIPPEDAQFVETRKLQRSDVAAIFQVPVHFLGDPNVKYNNREWETTDFLVFSLGAWMNRIEQEMDRQLLTEAQRRSGLFFKFDPRAFQRGDHQARADYMTKMAQWGIYTRNELRALEDLPPLPGLDDPMTPMNMVVDLDDLGPGDPANMLPQDEEPEPGADEADADEDEEEEDTQRAIVLAACQRVANKGIKRLRHLNATLDFREFYAQAEAFVPEWKDYAETVLGKRHDDFINLCWLAVRDAKDFNSLAKRWELTLATDLAERIVGNRKTRSRKQPEHRNTG